MTGESRIKILGLLVILVGAFMLGYGFSMNNSSVANVTSETFQVPHGYTLVAEDDLKKTVTFKVPDGFELVASDSQVVKGGSNNGSTLSKNPAPSFSNATEMSEEDILDALVASGALDAAVGLGMPQVHHGKKFGAYSGDISNENVCSTGDVGYWTKVWHRSMVEGAEKFKDNKWLRAWKDPKARIKEGGSCNPGTFVKDGGGGYDPCYESHAMKKGKENIKLGRWEGAPSGQKGQPSDNSRLVRNALIKRVVARKDVLDKVYKPLFVALGEGRDQNIVIMPVNWGYIRFALNWLASAKYGNVNLSNVIFFAADKQCFDVLRCIGATVVYDPETFGDFPMGANKAYGDHTFVKMMWLKTAPVWLALNYGFNVLFQDCDVVWFTDPVPMFGVPSTRQFLNKSLNEIDSIWMDDGARTGRFAPYYANTGFFYLRATDNTKSLWDDMFFRYDFIARWHSQQALTNMLLDNACQRGHVADVFCKWDIPGGYFAAGASKEKRMEEVLRHKPSMFHMHYTSDSTVKYTKFIIFDMWFLIEDKLSSEHDPRFTEWLGKKII
jgi:hypothetical protein